VSQAYQAFVLMLRRNGRQMDRSASRRRPNA